MITARYMNTGQTESTNPDFYWSDEYNSGDAQGYNPTTHEVDPALMALVTSELDSDSLPAPAPSKLAQLRSVALPIGVIIGLLGAGLFFTGRDSRWLGGVLLAIGGGAAIVGAASKLSTTQEA